MLSARSAQASPKGRGPHPEAFDVDLEARTLTPPWASTPRSSSRAASPSPAGATPPLRGRSRFDRPAGPRRTGRRRQHSPAILRAVSRERDASVGVHASIVQPGVALGDPSNCARSSFSGAPRTSRNPLAIRAHPRCSGASRPRCRPFTASWFR
jgi:hypothetical protein